MRLRVVAAAIVRDGRVLAARRRRDARWEFPGGKIEDGESAARALRRECREELAIDVLVGAQLGAAQESELTLTLFAATLDGSAPTTGPDHDRLRWVGAEELTGLDWLPLDRALLDGVSAFLRRAPDARET